MSLTSLLFMVLNFAVRVCYIPAHFQQEFRVTLGSRNTLHLKIFAFYTCNSIFSVFSRVKT